MNSIFNRIPPLTQPTPNYIQMGDVFFERQFGSLCAQHALNAVVQQPYYDAVTLAQIAHGLDDRERERMQEAGM